MSIPPQKRTGPYKRSGNGSRTTAIDAAQKSQPSGSPDLPTGICRDRQPAASASVGTKGSQRWKLTLADRQPLGIFSLPAAFLVLPAVESTSERILDSIMCGEIPDDLPVRWKFLVDAAEQRIDEALACLSADNDPTAADELITRYNRFVLGPDAVELDGLRSDLPSPLAELALAAAFTAGISDEFPSAEALDGEFRGVVLSVHAAAAIEGQDRTKALECLQLGIDSVRERSPVLAAQLLAQRAELLREDDAQVALAATHYRDALALVEDASAGVLMAELWLGLGATYHDQSQGRRAPLLEAVKCYQSALQCGLTIDAHPLLFAHAQSQIGLAYLTTPLQSSSDQLRMAIALQSFEKP